MSLFNLKQEQNDEMDEELEYQNPKFGKEEEDNRKEKQSINHILKAKITNYTNGLQVESVIGSLKSEYYVIPKFQRRFVWKKSQVSNLALSIIKEVPIPPLYLYLNDKKKEVVLDGQQRVTAMFLYFNNLWYIGLSDYHRFDFKKIGEINEEVRKLEEKLLDPVIKLLTKEQKLEIKKQIKEKYAILKNDHGVIRSKYYVDNDGIKEEISFSSLDKDEREFLLRKRIDITIVECSSPKPQKVYADIFKLLNSGGKLLGTQEIRNGIYWELHLYDELFSLNKNETWRRIYGKESTYSKDIEILIKMLALNHFTQINFERSPETGNEVERVNVSFDGTFNWSNIIEEYTEISINWSEEKVKSEISKLERFLQSINGVEQEEKKCNKAVFEAVFVAFCKLEISGNIDYTWLFKLEKEEEFQKGNVLSNKKSVQDRLSKALAKTRDEFHV